MHATAVILEFYSVVCLTLNLWICTTWDYHLIFGQLLIFTKYVIETSRSYFSSKKQLHSCKPSILVLGRVWSKKEWKIKGRKSLKVTVLVDHKASVEKPSLWTFQSESGLSSDTRNTKMSSRVKSFWDLLYQACCLFEWWNTNRILDFKWFE